MQATSTLRFNFIATDRNPFGLGREQVREIMDRVYARGDRRMKQFVLAHLAVALCLATFYDTWLVTLVASSAAVVMFFLSALLVPKSFITRCIAGISLQVFVALHIYQLHGLPEMHFFFFTAFTMMIAYQDWLCMWPGCLLIIGQHITLCDSAKFWKP